MGTQHSPVKRILLLLADGFSETQAMLYVSEFRESGLPLKIVGLTKRPVQSEHGVRIIPDLSIDTVIQTPFSIKLLILSDGQAAITVWLADPRTQLLLDRVQNQGGYLVTTAESVEMVKSALPLSSPLQLHQEPPAQDTNSSVLHVLVAPTDCNGLLKRFVQRLTSLLAE
jgi:hypothetical protein